MENMKCVSTYLMWVVSQRTYSVHSSRAIQYSDGESVDGESGIAIRIKRRFNPWGVRNWNILDLCIFLFISGFRFVFLIFCFLCALFIFCWVLFVIVLMWHIHWYYQVVNIISILYQYNINIILLLYYYCISIIEFNSLRKHGYDNLYQ